MSTKVSTGFGWLEDDVTGDPTGVRRHSDGKEFTIPLVETDPVTGMVKLPSELLVSDNIPQPITFSGFQPSLIPSLVNSSTASRNGNVISVSATGHGIPASKFDGQRIYFPGSANIVAGWKSNFKRTSADAFTCVDSVSGTVASESVNSALAMTDPVRVAGAIIPAGSIGATGRFKSRHASLAGATAAIKSVYYTLAGQKIMQSPSANGVIEQSFAAQGSTAKQIGMSGTSAALNTSVDMTKDQRIDLYVQISAAADYVHISNASAEFVYSMPQGEYIAPAFPSLKNATLTELPASAVRVINSRLDDGYVYGKHDNNSLHRSADGARTWERIGAIGALGGDSIGLLLPAGDGEVLLVGATSIYKTSGWSGAIGSVTRSQVLQSTTVAQFQTWGVSSDGAGRCVATHYAASPNFSASRYVWYSGNFGATWSVIRDLGASSENDQHLHFAIFDKYDNGRIYINHHQESNGGSGKSIEYSDDNGSTWNKVKHIQVIQSDGAVRSIQPTTVLIHSEGLVMGSDEPDTGLYILRRGENKVEYFAAGAQEVGALTVRSFATFAHIDPYNGVGYTCFKQQTLNGCGYIMASNGLRGDVVFSDQLGFPVSGQAALGGLLPGFYAIAFTQNEIVGTVVRPSAADPTKNAYWLFRSNKS